MTLWAIGARDGGRCRPLLTLLQTALNHYSSQRQQIAATHTYVSPKHDYIVQFFSDY